jgi:hypothetical protein
MSQQASTTGIFLLRIDTYPRLLHEATIKAPASVRGGRIAFGASYTGKRFRRMRS